MDKACSVQTSLKHRWPRPQHSLIGRLKPDLSLWGVSVHSSPTNQSPAGSKGLWVQNNPDKSLQTLVFERNTHTRASVNVCLSHTPPSSTCATNGKLVDLVWIEDCSFTQHTHRHKSTQCQSFTTDEQNPGLWFVSNTRSRPKRHL